jgi:hypothetical protein
VLLQDLSDDGHRRVNGIGDDKDKCLWASGRNACRELTNDASVDLEQVITDETVSVGRTQQAIIHTDSSRKLDKYNKQVGKDKVLHQACEAHQQE